MIGELIIGWALTDIFGSKTENSSKSSNNKSSPNSNAAELHSLQIENEHLKKHLLAKDAMLDAILNE
ncbi:MAG: hypothetical protein NT007_14355 [Candidatus Kapabacteria bacterium]|nr:hypothetical protein [Candidatus Kapabacteria bacterium]